MRIEDSPETLKALQDAIYRDKVLRARAMTPAERLMEAFACTDMSLQMMLAGSMSQRGLTNEAEGWREVARRIDLGRRLHDGGRFIVPATPAS